MEIEELQVLEELCQFCKLREGERELRLQQFKYFFLLTEKSKILT